MLSYETARTVWEGLEAARTPELRTAVVQAGVRYARLRTDWALATRQARTGGDLSDRRRQAHDAFIDACNELSRRMIQRGEDISWRQLLGDDRLTIGDFACYLHCFLGLKAR